MNGSIDREAEVEERVFTAMENLMNGTVYATTGGKSKE